jgi:hypothetical protein
LVLDSPLLALILLGFGAIVFISFFFLPRLKSNQEAGITPLYEERCSIRKSLGFGLWAGGNLPLCRLSLYSNFMVIAFLWPTLIPYSEIDRVEYKRHLFSKGIHIHQRSTRNQGVITVFSRNPEKILEVLSSKVQVEQK